MLKIIENDGYLKPHEAQLNARNQWFFDTLHYIQNRYESLTAFSLAYQFYGFNLNETTQEISFREWLPHAKSVCLIGDFNDWNQNSHPLHSIENGNWEIFLTANSIPNNSKVKLAIETSEGNWIYKIPAYIQYVVQNEDLSYDGVYLKPSQFKWEDQTFTISDNFRPIIYETHKDRQIDK